MSRSIPNNPPNSLTPSYSTVSSPNGFSAGDLVYFKDSSFGTIPSNAVATAPFPVTATNAGLGGPTGKNAFISVFNENLNNAVSARQRFAATLTNGNIVVVYSGGDVTSTSQGRPLFKIVTDSFETAVAETQISASDSTRFSVIGVAALTGGGFAVAYISSTSTARIAVFSNTGTVVTAPFTPAGWSTGNYISIAPLPAGGFVVAMNNTTSAAQYRVATFNATGTQVNTNVPVISSYTGNDTPQLTVLSDGKFVVFTRSALTTGVIQGFNADCTTVGAAQTITVGNPTGGGGQSICTTTTDEVVLGFSSGGAVYLQKYFIATNSLGAATAMFGGGVAYNPTIVAMPGGNIGVIMIASGGPAVFQVVSSTFVDQSTVTYRGISLDTGDANYTAVCGVVTASKLTFFASSTNITTAVSISNPIQYFQFGSTSPFSPIYRRTGNPTVSTTTSTVNGYARGNSTPNSAAFLAATSTTLSAPTTTLSGTNYIRAPYMARAGVTYLDSCVLLDGRMVVAYCTGTATAGFVTLDQQGSVLSDTSFTIPTSTTNIIKCTALNNGKLALAIGPASNADIYIRVYDSSLTLQTSTTLFTAAGITAKTISSVVGGGFGISGLGSSSFVLAYTNNANNRPTATIFTDAVAVINTVDLALTTAAAISVAGNLDGSFSMSFYYSGASSGRVSKFIQTSATSWSSIYTSNFSWSSVCIATTSCMHPNGVAFHIANPTAAGNSATLVISGNNGGALNTYAPNTGQINMGAAGTIGATGEYVFVTMDTGAPSYMLNVFAPGTGILTGSALINNNFTPTSPNSGTSNAGPSLCVQCLYNQIYAMVYRGTGNEMYVATFSTANVTYSTTLTAGVTPSGTGLVPSPSNGYYLAGVSASDCAAGGTGVIQKNGTATLNSQYPAGTTSQAFDFTSPGLDVGVRGTIAGRNMIISGV